MLDSAAWAEEHSELLRGVDLLHQAALLASCCIWVNHTLCRCHVEALYSDTKCFWIVIGSDGVNSILDTGANFALGGAVAQGCLGVCENSLLLALDICHFE